MSEIKIKEVFQNLADISHNVDGYTVYDKYKRNTIIKAMSEAKFIEAIGQIKLLNLHHVVGRSEQFVCPKCGDKEVIWTCYCNTCKEAH